MARAIALAAPLLHAPGLDRLRAAIVCGCALALIFAGRALPALAL